MHPVRGGTDHHERREDEREGGEDVGTAAPRDDELDPEDEPAHDEPGGDQLEEAPTGVLAVRESGRVQRVQPAEEVGDLQADKKEEQRVDHHEHRRRGGRADETAQSRDDGRERGYRRASGDEEDATGDPATGERQRRPADHLADRPALRIEGVAEGAGENRVRAREKRSEHDEERKRQREADSDRRDPSSGASGQWPAQLGKRRQ